MTESPPSAPSSGGLVIIGVSTVIAGIAGYAVTLLVYRVVGAASYAVFAVFWAGMYLVIGGLSGIQQEVTRATQPLTGSPPERRTRARNFGLVVAVLIAGLIITTSPAWMSSVFPSVGLPLVWPLAVGAASSVAVAVLVGSLYGASQWRKVALMVVFDAILRVILIGLALAFTHDIVLLAWAAALPFPLAVVVLWPVVRRRFALTTEIRISYRALTWNTARAVGASISTAVLVSGFPLLLGVAAKGQPGVIVGELIFTITLTRAPLIVSIMSLQSYILVRFRDRPTDWPALFGRVVGVVAVGAVVIAAFGWWLGVPVLQWVSGHSITLGGGSIAVLVLSSALVGLLCVTGPAVLARGRHFIYSTGWIAAAVATIGTLAMDEPFVAKVMVALLVGPVVGLIVHLVALLSMIRADRRQQTA